jgi:thiol-disulfide isomerase/thioredoxin
MAVMAVIALLVFGVATKGEAKLEVGDRVPVAELAVLAADDSPDAGTTTSIEDFRGQWVLINIWASWCGPCEDESPDLADFQDANGGDNFTVLGVQTQDQTPEGLAFVEEFGLNYPSIRDGSGDYADELGASGVPESILVDPDGNVAYTRPGPVDADILNAEVLPLIQGT